VPLEQYAAYREAVIGACARAMTLDELTRLLNADPTVKARRSAARTELQAIFNLIRGHFGIPALPVYLPMRKKIAVRGQAHMCVGVPKEIRIYTVEGSRKPYNQWTPSDITCNSVSETLECLIHETAHVLEAHRHRVMSHDENFVIAYNEIDQFLKTCGFAPLRDPSLRLMGAPRQSVATSVRNVEQRQLRSKVQPGRGCVLVGFLSVAVMVGLAIVVVLQW
jgi:hypothetical protein